MISSIHANETNSVTIKKYTQVDASGDSALSYNYDNSCGLIVGSQEKIAHIKCRICFDQIEEKQLEEYNKSNSDNKLIHPCHCKDSFAYCHQNCLKSWVISNSVSASKLVQCEMCKTEYVIKHLKGKLSKLEKKSIIKIFSIFVVAILLLNTLLYILISGTILKLFSPKFIFCCVNVVIILIFICTMQDKIKLIFYGANIDFVVYDVSMRYKV